MAEADGSIVFDTKINKGGFNAGAADIKRGLSSLNRGLSALKSNMEKAFSGSVRSIGAFQAKSKTLKTTIEELQLEMQKLGDEKLESEDFIELQKNIDKARTAWSKLLEKREKQEALGVGEDSKAWKRLSYDIETAKAKLDDYQAEWSRMVKSGENIKLGIDTEKYAELSRQLEQAQEQYERLIAEGQQFNNVAGNTPTFSFSALADTMKNASTVSDYFDGLQKRIDGALKRLLVTIAARLGAAIVTVRAKISALPEIGSRIADAFRHPEETLGSIFESAAARIDQGFGSIAAGAKYAAGVFLNSFGKAAMSGLQKIPQLAAKAGKALIAAFGRGVKAAISGVGKALRSVADRFTSFRKGASDTGKGVAGLMKKFTSLGTMLKRGLIRRAISGIISSMKAGLDNLAQASPAFNKTMSALKSSLTQLKNSFASAFAPILTAVLPVLQTLIGWLSTAISYIGQFFAALSGGKTFTKAVAVQEDYAQSLGNTAKAAKEAKNELLGFDKINKLSDDSDAGGGSGGVSPSAMFEDVPIESSIAKFVQSLKDAWNAEDFTEVGAIIGRKLNEMVAKVDEAIKWDNIGEKITTWVHNLADVFNSLVDTVDWENIGNTVADGLNTIIYTLETFVDEFDLDKLGTALSDIVNGLNNTVDWDALGRSVSKGLNEITRAVNNFADNTDWKDVGKHFATTMNTLVDGVDGTSLGKSLSAKLKIAFEAASGFVKNFDWATAGVKISETVYAWFDNINWGDLGETISRGIAGAFNTLAKALETFDWQGLAKKTEEFIAGIDWGAMASKLFESLGAALGGIGSYLGTLLGDAWQGVVDYFSQYVDWGGTPGEIIAGLWEGIKNAMSNAWQWIKDCIFTPFIDGFKKAFGIHSPSTVMKEQGGYLIDGLKEGLSGIWEKIKEKFDEMLAKIKQWFTDKKNDLLAAWDKFKEGIGEVVATIKGKIDETFTKAKEKWDGFKKKTVELTAKLASGVKDWIMGLWEKFLTWFRGGKKADRKLEIGAKNTTTKDDTKTWWEKIKEKWGAKTLDAKAKVTEVSFSDAAKKTLQGQFSVHVEGGGRLAMATGGVVTKPTNALIGEAGPEAVIPLKNNLQWLDTVSKYVTSHLPAYATGNVIPANFGRFAAILGDSREPEFVSPESTMKKAVIDALRESGLVGSGEAQTINLTLNLDGKAIYNDVVRINRQRTRMGGANPLVV